MQFFRDYVYLSSHTDFLKSPVCRYHSIFKAAHKQHCFKHSGSSEGVPVIAFEGGKRNLGKTGTLYGPAFHLVVEHSGCAVYSDCSQLFRREA